MQRRDRGKRSSVEGLRVLSLYGRFVSEVVFLHYLLFFVSHTLSREVICRLSVHAGGWVAGVGKGCKSETSCVSPGNVTYARITRDLPPCANKSKTKKKKDSRCWSVVRCSMGNHDNNGG